MLDRYRAAASPFSGSSLLAERYRDVPLLSFAWGIGHVGLPFSENGKISLFGLGLPLPEDTTFVVSLRAGVGRIHLRVEEIAPKDEDAAQSAEILGTLITLLQSVPPQVAAHSDKVDADAIRELAESLKVEQHKDRAVVTGSVPLDLLKKIAESSTELHPAEVSGR